MKVKVRTRQKCPICKSKFQITALGLLCIKHKPKMAPTNFYLDWYWKGENFRLYDFGSFKEALTKANSIEQEITDYKFRPENYKGQAAKVNHKYAFRERFEQFKNLKKKELKPSYVRKINQYEQEYVKVFASEDVRVINRDMLLVFYEALLDQGLSKKTIYNKLGVLHSFFASLKEREVIRDIPRFPKVKFIRKKAKWISKQEQIQVLQHISEVHRPIFLFMFNSGCRQGEARALHWEDVDFKQRIITIRHNFSETILTSPKGNSEREIPITKALREILSAVPKTIRSDFVFNLKGKAYYESALGKIWRQACKNAEIEPINLHAASRHSFASQLINKGTSLEIVGEILGHVDKRTTQIYSHVHLNAMREAMED